MGERLSSITQSLTPRILVLSAVALTAAIVFSAFIWLSAAKSSFAEKEVAENFQKIETQPIPNQIGGDNNVNSPQASPFVENDYRSPTAENAESKPPNSDRIKSGNRSSTPIVVSQNLSVANNAPPKPGSKIALRKSESPNEEKANVSSTRGGGFLPECSERQAIDLTVGMNKEAVVLKWKKIPNAAKYHLYVSDEEEILVDEYETEQGTTYALKKPLAPQKTYQWKVVVTLQDGKTTVGDSQKFTIKDLQSNQKKSERREKSLIRCSESKLNR